MTLNLDLEPGLEARLHAKARAEGVPIEGYVKTLIESVLTPVSLEEAIALYASHAVSQGQAAALAGVSRSEFIDALGRAGASVFQYGAEDAIRDAGLD